MNCLLLLLILFGCGQGNGICSCLNNGMCRNIVPNDSCCNRNRATVNRTENCGCKTEVKEKEDCGCSRGMNHGNHENCGAFTVPQTARTQYPYLESEPHTCGCEENK